MLEIYVRDRNDVVTIYSYKYNITTDYDVYNHIQLIPSCTKSYL
jgi:hypothetical protein